MTQEKAKDSAYKKAGNNAYFGNGFDMGVKYAQSRFPNGFNSWQETHFEIVSKITLALKNGNVPITEHRENNGIGGLYELAEDWTNNFEKLSENKEWDGDFFDEIDEFFDNKLKTLT